MPNKMKPAQRVRDIPPYLFKAIDDKKNALKAQGKKLLNFGIGDPDLPTPPFVIEALAKAAALNENQKYPSYEGGEVFRKGIASYMKDRFGVTLDAKSQIMALIGSKEGIAHFAWAFLEAGDVALVPDPGYPVYATTTRFSGAEPVLMPLREENGFFPDVGAIPAATAERAKVMYLNYPNNPTGAVPTGPQIEELLAFARKYRIIVLADAAYAELVYDPKDRLSLLTYPGAEEVVIEFHSFSKTFNMTGWRLGFAAGNKDLISGLLRLKTNVDSGVFDAIQLAGVKGLEQIDTYLPQLLEEYRRRRDTLSTILREHDMPFFPPKGAFYLWARCPAGYTSLEYTMTLMEKAGIVTTPGSGFGTYGEGYIRFALTQPVDTIKTIPQGLDQLRKY